MAHGLAIWGGPVATIAASVTAAVVTIIFNKRQASIAEAQKEIAASQRDIAHEKLKADLFDRRLAIYEALRNGCLHCMRNARESKISKVVEAIRPVDGALFLFGTENSTYLLNLQEQLIEYAAQCETLRELSVGDASYEELIRVTQKGLVDINKSFIQLPKQIKEEMGARDISASRR